MLIPKFIPMPISVLEEGYWIVEACIIGYLDFYQKNEDFYCTNEELSELLHMSESTVKRALKNLNENWLIEISKTMREWGWTLRKTILTENGLLLCSKINRPEGSNWAFHNINQEINNNFVPFETFRTEFPHARKGKKAESKKYYEQLDSNEVIKQVRILVWKIRAWLEESKRIPACERRIRDFTPLNEDVIKQDLVKICKRHLNAWGDMKQRSHELKETFWEEEINKIVKAIQQKDNPKNLFIKQTN